jgi:hypothetical protein
MPASPIALMTPDKLLAYCRRLHEEHVANVLLYRNLN